jgi:hypothetical protein
MCLETSQFSSNNTTEGITLTINLSHYIGAVDVDMSFEYKYQFIDINADGDYLYIRGSDTDPWIQIEEFLPYAHWVTSENNISAILEDNGQAFSSSFQVHFSQGRYIGYAIDNFSIDALNALPIELTSFTAKQHGEDALLKWVTASELNNDRFEIEVAVQPQPHTNDNFKRIGTVAGSGTTTTNQYYTFTDYSPLKSGIRYYRLKQIDLNGESTYSEIEAVDFGQMSEVRVFPNPFTNELNIAGIVGNVDLQKIQLVNTSGQLIYETQSFGEVDQLILNFGKELPEGVYFLRLINEKETMTYPIVRSEK